jgi:hypothetical protein
MRQRHAFQRHSETLLPIFTTLLAHKANYFIFSIRSVV